MINISCPFCHATAAVTNAIIFHGEIPQEINGVKSTYLGYGLRCDKCLSVWSNDRIIGDILSAINTDRARKAHTAAVFHDICTTEGLETTTRKFSIHGVDGAYDIYFITGWCGKHLTFVDIYLGGMHEQNIRTLVELACRTARQLLESTQLTASGLSKLWRRLEFEPKGFCAQLPNENQDGVVGGFVWSLLDAISRYLIVDMKQRGIDADAEGVTQDVTPVVLERNLNVPKKD